MSALSTETVKYVEALKVALEQVKNYQANNLSVNADEIMEKNNFKKAIKEVNALKSYLNNCSNIFDKEPDDVISVYVSLAKKYLNSMEESVKLKANIEKIYAENNVTDFFDLPSKVRAKQREVIVEKGLMSEFDILRAVSSQYDYPIIDLTGIDVDPKATALLTQKFCEENVVFPIGFDNDYLVVAIDDPMNITIEDELQFQTGYQISLMLATHTSIIDAIKVNYGKENAKNDNCK